MQGVRAGLCALQGQMAVNIPPLAVQDLVKVCGIEAVDAQPPGQGGVNVCVRVHQPGQAETITQVMLECFKPSGFGTFFLLRGEMKGDSICTFWQMVS